MASYARQEWIEDARRTPIDVVCRQLHIDLKRAAANEFEGPCPKCGGTNRFSINTAKQVFNCRHCEKGGGVIDLVMFKDGIDLNAAVEKITGRPPPKMNGAAAPWRNEGDWVYSDADGKPYSKVIRWHKPDGEKIYLQYHLENGQWVKGVKGTYAQTKIPYRLPELLEGSDRTEPVYICEGEKCADAVVKLGLTATTASEGAGKWTADLNEHFRDRIAWILLDNDEPGRKHAQQVASNLHGIAREVKIVALPGLGDKEDVYDWIARGGTREKLDEIGEKATAWQPATTDDFLAFWHGDVVAADSRPWLIYGTIPETGSGLLSGQWGTYKTFTAIDLACAVMSGTAIFDSEIDRRGGSLLYAAEGQNEVPIRLDASLKNRWPELSGNAPFTWLTPEKFSLKLLDPDSVKTFIARAKAIDAEMRKRFGVPLVLIEIDTIVTTAGFKKSGDEDDAVIGAQVIAALKQISSETGTFVLGVDHFGKTADTGTRGTSAKEANVDVVLATLGDKSLSGVVTNPHLAVRKVRGGIAGREYPFTTEEAKTDEVDSRGRQITTLKIKWSEVAPAAKDKKDPWSKSLRLLRRALMALLAEHGKELAPYPDDPERRVRAADKELVRCEFYQDYPAEGGTHDQRQEAKRKAFNRAIKDAQAANLIGFREIDLVQYIWLATAPSQDGN
jgi:hypothetical protein